VLVGRAQSAVEGQDLGAGAGAGEPAAQGVLRIPDLALPREEHEHIARGLARELIEGIADRVDEIALGTLLRGLVPGIGHERAVPDLDRVGAPRHLDDGSGSARGVREMGGEARRVDRRARDDDLELGALRKQLAQEPDEEVNSEAALVGLVDDDGVVSPQQPVAVDLVEQDAVGHELDARRGARPVGEAHLVADDAAELLPELLSDALRDRARGDAPRLRVPDVLITELEEDLGQLRRLARAGLAGDNDDLVLPDGARDVLPLLADRQLRGEGDGEGRVGHQPSIVCARAGVPAAAATTGRAI